MSERRPPVPAGWAALDPPPPATADTDLSRAYARCFAGPEGARVLADLESLTLGRVLGPEAGDAALRHLEGQRALVLRIRSLVARGRTAP